MWPVRYPSLYNVWLTIFLLSGIKQSVCSAIKNSNFNEHIREFSDKEDNTGTTNKTTLLKQDKERHTGFIPIPNPVTFKEVPDNELSYSSYSQGHLHQSDYGMQDYDEDNPPHGYGYEFEIHEPDNHDHPGSDHHGPDHFHSGHHSDNHGGHHHMGHHHMGHHYKHYNHDLAVKKILLPIAGIALLGAAAALVTNPVLLQLGVVSGKRKRRNTEEITAPDFEIDVDKWTPKQEITVNSDTDQNLVQNKDILQLSLNKVPFLKRISDVIKKQSVGNVNPTASTSVIDARLDIPERIPDRGTFIHKDKFISVPLKKNPS